MKFDRKDLFKNLSLLEPAISSKSAIAQLRHIWFDGNTAFAYNGSLGIKVDLRTGFKFAALGSPLLKLLRDGSSDNISLEESSGVLTIKLGRALVELPTLPLGQAPWRFSAIPKIIAELPLDGIAQKALKRANIIRISGEPTRIEHRGIILFASTKTELFLYSTDSRALVEVVLPIPKGVPLSLHKSILPFEFVESIQNLGCNSLAVCSDCLYAKGKDVVVYGNLLDSSNIADLPKLVYDIMKDKGAGKMSILPANLGDALERAEILADGSEIPLSLSVANSTLILEGKLPLGKFKESISLEKYDGEAHIGVDGRLLKKSLSYGKHFAIMGSRLVVEGDDDFLFVQAEYTA